MKEPITVNGLTKLKEELVFLKEKKRPEIVSAISEARSHGDLKENAEYHAAKEQQSHNEGRIQQIEDIIARANVIDVTKIENLGKVIFGSTVYLKDLDSNEKLTYKIVGKDEADLKKNLIYNWIILKCLLLKCFLLLEKYFLHFQCKSFFYIKIVSPFFNNFWINIFFNH